MGKIETTVVEKIVEVPHQLVQEVALEVPQVCVAEVVTQTAQPQQQRIVQTGRAHKRGKDRAEVVQHVTAQPLEIHTYAAPMTTSITMAAPPMSSITMAAPPLTYTTQ